MEVEGSFFSLNAIRGKINASGNTGGKIGNYGAFAFLLTLITLFLNAFILTEYQVLQPLYAPISIVTLLGLWGLVFGLTVMKHRFGKFMFGLSIAIGFGTLLILLISIFS